MNKQPTRTNRNPDRKDVEAALNRAANRARERARATGTRLVVSRSGTLFYLRPEATGVADSRAPYDTE